MPKDGFAYFVGLLPIKVLPFLIISGIARIPSIISSTICGSTLASEQYIVSILVLIITIVLSILGMFTYKKILNKKTNNSVRNLN